MCGFAGVIWKGRARPFDEIAALRLLGDSIAHRGPDGEGMHCGDGFAAVHRRLAIIDIENGQQPMTIHDGRVGIVYNGEIYNHELLRAELEADGTNFETHCDTEVLLRTFAAYGVEAFARCEGMFAAFIWDLRDETAPRFYLVRDHLGVKPLYLYEDESCWVFSSEIRAILRLPSIDLSPDPAAFSSYLTYRYVHAPMTPFRRIRRVEAGVCVRISSGSSFHQRFWDIPVAERPLDISIDDAAAELRRLLRVSVKRQQMSEVPVGLLLSGGLDSSVIASLCRDVGARLASFNIGFPDLNEFSYSDDVAHRFELPHYKIVTTPAEIATRFDSVVKAMDDLIADPACFPLSILCDSIKSHVTVVLSGEGSDEMLGGYPQYRRVLLDPPAPCGDQFERFLRYSWYFNDVSPPVVGGAAAAELRTHRKYFNRGFLLEGMLGYDQKTWLSENLMMKADKILMSHSLEGRFPFLSTDVMRFVSSLPQSHKVGCANGKTVLRRAFERDLPESVLERKKMGFSVPVAELVSTLRDRFFDLAASAKGGHFAGVLDHEAIRRDMEDHYAGRNDQPLRMWTLLVMYQWMDGALSPSRRCADMRSKEMQASAMAC